MRDMLREHGVKLMEIGSFRRVFLSRSAVGRLRVSVKAADIIHVHTSKSMLCVLMAAPIRFFRHSVATIHNPHQHSTRVMWIARRVVALSKVQARDIFKRTLGLVRPVAIPNGILGGYRIPMNAKSDASNLPDLGDNAVLFVGGLYERKGLDILVRAMQLVLETVPSAHLFVIGNRDNPEIEAMVTDMGLDSAVTFLGFRKNPIPYMSSASVFVVPSREEGFGNVLVEARAAQVPIIASDTGGIPTALSGGKAGILVPVGDFRQIAKNIIAVLNQPAFAAELRARTREGIEQFTVPHFVAAYEKVYESVLS
jgi:glycosyltransferase involved in cell wall biosynthesis